jgi:hypothetical protein
MDLHEFHETLRSDADFTPRSLDPHDIMVAGGRLRRRRRVLVAGGTAAVVLAAVVGITTIARPEPRTATPPAATTTPSVSAAPTHQPKLTSMNDYQGPFGTVIDTGLTNADHEKWALFGVRPPGAKSTAAYGLCIGSQDAKGDLEESYTIDETTDSAVGFHTIQAAMALDRNIEQPAFGYYVGPAKRITVTVDGKVLDAHLAPWSLHPDITVFWFSPADVKPDDQITTPAAYDAAGVPLPKGNPQISTY